VTVLRIFVKNCNLKLRYCVFRKEDTEDGIAIEISLFATETGSPLFTRTKPGVPACYLLN